MSRPRRGPPDVAVRVFSALLRLYPEAHRRRFASQMRQFFIDEYEAKQQEALPSSNAAFLLRSYARLAFHGVAARFDMGMAGGRSTGRTVGERIHGLGRAFRFATRRLLRSRGYSLTSVVTLALGIGASATVYGVLYPVLLAPLPYPAPDRLVATFERSPGPDGANGWVSPLTFRDWRERATRMEGLAGWRLSLLTWTGETDPTSLRGWAVSSGFFRVLGLPMALGRGFSQEEDQPGGPPVVVLSDGLWRRGFGGSPDVLGRTMILDGTPHTIVGVANPALDFPSPGEYWVPLGLDYGREPRDFRYLGVVGRIRDGTPLDDAWAELSGIASRVSAENPGTNEGWGAAIVPLKEDLVGGVRPVLTGIAAAVALLLLISLGNLTSLSVARGVDRRGEQGTRRALGASRWHLVSDVLAESLVLSAVGGALGALAACWGVEALAGRLDAIPRSEHIGVDAPVLVFTVGIACLVGLSAGLLSAFLPGRGGAAAVGQGRGRGTPAVETQGARAAVLTAQVALAFTLLVGGLLLGRSLVALSRIDPGFSPEHMVTFAVQLPSDGYEGQDAWRDFYARTANDVRSLPGIEAAGAVTPLPLAIGSVASSWALSSDLRSPLDPPVMAHMRTATPGYLEAMGIRLRSGRFFGEGDRANAAPVAVVNAAFAQRYLDGRDPLGVQVSAADPGNDTREWATIVGVVDDVRFRSLTSAVQPEIYLPMAQFPSSWGYLVVRSSGRTADVVRAVTDAVHRVDPDLPLSDIRSGRDLIATQLRSSRLVAVLGAFFAVAAATFAVVGILGLLAILVSRRIKELGLRMVFGAPAATIRWFVLSKGMKPVGAGLVLGVAVSLAMSPLLAGMLHGMISARDPLTYLLAGVGLTVVSAFACLVPALRAGRADPLALIRSE